MKIKVNLVDDHQMVVDGLALLLGAEDDIEVLDTALSGSEALAKLRNQQPNVILLDYSLGKSEEHDGYNGLQLAIEIMEHYPEIRIMMLTMHDMPEVILPCIQAGVHGYMLKSEKNAQFGKAIRELHFQGHYFTPEVAKDLAISLRKQEEEEINLSDRELEVLEHLYQGESTKEIAENLFISHHTVESHRKNLIQKFSAKNSVHLIYLALQKGYLKVG
jgi:DNA-binding NarL/FixJ family response regulator